MKNTKYIIIAIVIVVVIIITLLLLLINTRNNNNNIINTNNIEENILQDNIQVEENASSYGSYKNNADQEIVNSNIKAVTNSTKFYTVANCIQNYIDSVTAKNKEAILYILSSNYISNNNININNVLNYVQNFTKKYTFTPIKMNVLEGENTEVYSVYGKILEENKLGLGEDIYFKVNICTNNFTFSIEPINSNSFNNSKLENEDKQISKNNYNVYSYYRITNEELIKKYFEYYKNCMIYSPNEAYNLLNSEYKTKRFANKSEFEQYLKDNQFYLYRITLSKYGNSSNNNTKQYIAIDNYDNYYIFEETAVMQFTVYLDNYTIETDTYKENYGSYSESEKTQSNISKFIKMINNKDYKSAYNLLNSTFKNNNFNTQDKFTSFIKSKVFDKNKIKFEDYSTNNNYHIWNISLFDYSNSSNKVSMQIIMQLKEGTDFELSFNFK